MSEFSEQDAKNWLSLAMEKGCAIHAAIYYSLYFQLLNNTDGKLKRAEDFFRRTFELPSTKEHE